MYFGEMLDHLFELCEAHYPPEARREMFNLRCFLTMSQFQWFLRCFSRSVGGCVLSTDGPRKDHRHTVQMILPSSFYKGGGCLQQPAG